MSGEVECVTLGLATVEFLPEIHISHLITCKKYDEKITTILMCRAYDDIFGRVTESNQRQVHKNKRTKRWMTNTMLI
jgi:hypothetical protein